MEARLKHPMLPSGAPAWDAASDKIFAARKEHCSALGWGENTMALPAFRAINAL
jgi:hypothetical protein